MICDTHRQGVQYCSNTIYFFCKKCLYLMLDYVKNKLKGKIYNLLIQFVFKLTKMIIHYDIFYKTSLIC